MSLLSFTDKKEDTSKRTYESWKENNSKRESGTKTRTYEAYKNGSLEPEKTDRGTLDRIFGMLGNTSIIEGLYNVTDNDPSSTFGEGLVEGLKYMNPFEDDVSGRHTFSDVLQNIGWKDNDPNKFTIGDVGRGVAGFAGDVLLDPLSYVNPFSAAGKVVKGTGVTLDGVRASAKAAKVGHKIDDVADAASNLKKVRNLSKLSLDDAKKIVSNFKGYEGQNLDDVAQKLLDDYNRDVMRAAEGGDDFVVGLKHLPFMERRAQALNKTIVKSEKLRELGDKTIAPYYNSLSKKLRVSSLGQKFSTVNQLETLAQTDGFEALAKYHTDQLLKGFKRLDIDTSDIKVADDIQAYWETLTKEEQNKWLQAYETGAVDRARKFIEIRTKVQDTYEKVTGKNKDDIFEETDLFSTEKLRGEVGHFKDNPRNKNRIPELQAEVSAFLKQKSKEMRADGARQLRDIFGKTFKNTGDLELVRDLRSLEKLNLLSEDTRFSDLMRYYSTHTSKFPEVRDKLYNFVTEQDAYNTFLKLPNDTKNSLIDAYTHKKIGTKEINDAYSGMMGSAKSLKKYNDKVNTIFENSDQYKFYKAMDEINGTNYMDSMKSLDQKLAHIDMKNAEMNHGKTSYEDLGKAEGLDIAKVVQERMDKIADEEYARGLLSKEQLDALKGKYLYHITSDEFSSLGSLLKEERPGVYNPDILGILKKFNKRRTGGTIAEINKAGTDQEKEILKTALHEIYLTRCLGSNHLVYGTDVQDFIVKNFGEDYRGVVTKGNTLVARFQDIEKKFREYASDIAEEKLSKLNINEDDYDEVLRNTIRDEYDALLNDFTKHGNEDFLKNYVPNITMQPLTPQQADYLNGMPRKYYVKPFQISNNILDRTNVLSRTQKMEQQHAMLTLYDKFLNLWKLNNSLIAPSFHVQNSVSNAFQSFLGVGEDAFNIRQIKRAADILRTRDPKQTIELGGKVWTYKELEHVAKKSGVVDELFSTYEFGKQGSTLSSFDSVKFEGWKSINPLDPDNNIAYQASTVVGTNIESVQRMNLFMSGLKQGKSVEEAAEMVDEFLFNYGALTDFEKETMKRIIPFYTFMRKNIPMELKQMLEQPQIFSTLNKAFTNIEKMDGENYKEENERNEWRQDFVQIPYSGWAVNPQLPYQQLDKFDWNKMLGSTSPLIKFPIEMMRGEYLYTGIPIDNIGEYALSQTIPTSYLERGITGDQSPEEILSRFLGFPAAQM